MKDKNFLGFGQDFGTPQVTKPLLEDFSNIFLDWIYLFKDPYATLTSIFIILGSQAFKQLDQAKSHFHGIKFRVQDIILSRTDNQNILSDANLFTKAIELHQKIMASGYNDSNICLLDANDSCMVVSVLQVDVINTLFNFESC